MNKAQGAEMIIFGTGGIVLRLTKLKLIDEYHFLINPVFISAGKTIFKNEEAKSTLKLPGTRICLREYHAAI